MTATVHPEQVERTEPVERTAAVHPEQVEHTAIAADMVGNTAAADIAADDLKQQIQSIIIHYWATFNLRCKVRRYRYPSTLV